MPIDSSLYIILFTIIVILYLICDTYHSADINECQEDEDSCIGNGQYCSNIVGSFECWCSEGYRNSSMLDFCEGIDHFLLVSNLMLLIN